MKRVLSVFLVVAMVMSLAACGSGKVRITTQESSKNAEASAAESVSSESEDAKVSQESELESDAENVSESTPSVEDAFEEVLAVDNDQCTIKITGIDSDDIWGYTLKTYMENKSSDKTYMFSVESASINGVKAEPGFATEIAAGKKSNEEIHFSKDLSNGKSLEAQSVGDFTDIRLSFIVYDSEDWAADPVAKETVHVYPLGKDKAVEFVRASKDTDTVIVDNDDISVVVTNYDEGGFWGYTANLYLVNKTDKEFTYSVEEVSVNGFMVDPFWADSVCAGESAFSSISWSDSAFEENNITKVEEIEMKLRVYDAEDWSADAVYEEVVILKP